MPITDEFIEQLKWFLLNHAYTLTETTVFRGELTIRAKYNGLIIKKENEDERA